MLGTKCCFVCHFVAQTLFQLSNIHSVVQLIVNFSSVNLQENGFNYVLSTFHCSGTSHLSFCQVEFNDLFFVKYCSKMSH